MRKNRAHIIIISIVIFGVLITGLIGHGLERIQYPVAALKPTVNFKVQSSNTVVPLSWPSIGQAAVGAKGYGVLASNGAQTPVPTASVAKLITALAVLKTKPITKGQAGPTITITQNDVALYNQYAAKGGSITPVNYGEQLSEYQILQAMLLPSSNNLADTLAIWAFGSLGAYSAYANQMLNTRGITNTHVGSDASGLDSSSKSTAVDLVRIGELGLSNPVIAGIVSQSSAELPVAGTVRNVNWLLGSYGINGIKTGNSDEAGGAYLMSSDYEVTKGKKVTIITAVMKSTTLQTAMSSSVTLLNSAQKAFTMTTAFAVGQSVGFYQAPWQGKVSAVTSKEVKSIAWQGKVLNKPTVVLEKAKVPSDKSSVTGFVRYDPSNGDSSPVILSQPITKPSTWWRLSHY